jgi:signal transduction histidine kinase
MEVHFKSNEPNYRISDPDQELTVYRIVQEQMNNIHKYAKCHKVAINLYYDADIIRLDIEDDGIGFDLQQKAEGIGLKNIRNRVDFYSGQVNIVSAPGEGCKLEISMPVSREIR